MEGIAILILISLVVFIFIMPVMALAAAKSAQRSAGEALDRIRDLEERMRVLHQAGQAADAAPQAWQKTTPPEKKPFSPPPLPPVTPESDRKMAMPTEHETHADVQPATEETAGEPDAGGKSPAGSSALPGFSIEQFLGVKLFAWLGGVALFFGIIFFVKYAFEHNLIPPVARVAIGFLTGLGLLTGGWFVQRRENYRVLAQSFCATGVLILYGVSFAAHAVYQLPLFNSASTFALMAAVTVTAFLTAVRHDALVVAVLGMLGGFLTPALLPLVQDHPLALFGYIALLDAGLLALASRGRWTFLASGAVTGTILTLVHWAGEFFRAGGYAFGNATLVPMAILLGFCLLFMAASWRVSVKHIVDFHVPASGFAMLATALGFAFYFLGHPSITGRAPLLYTFVLLVNLGAIVSGLLHPRLSAATMLAAAATFLHLAAWTVGCLAQDTLITALAIYLVFGMLHTLWPAFVRKLAPGRADDVPDWQHAATPWLPVGLIALMAVPLLVLRDVSLVLWPAVLLANLLCIIACARRGVAMPLLAALSVTLLTALIWLLRMPQVMTAAHTLLGVILSFSFFFTGAGMWLARSFAQHGQESPDRVRKLIPLASAAMPFLLLVLMILRVPMADPSPVFVTGLALAAMLAVVALKRDSPALQPGALALCLLMQAVWHARHFDLSAPNVALAWYLGFYALFTTVPFVFRKACSISSAPWIASALSGVGHYLLVYDLVKRAFPNQWMGLVPAAFAVPALILLGIEWRKSGAMQEPGRTRIAWFGGVALLFITLVFPVQFDHQWLTVAWALEGAALVWLFRHVPHQGLIATGVALLGTSFARLSLNPAVFVEYERSGSAILNWHLYVYGVVAVAHLVTARMLPKHHVGMDAKPLRNALCLLGGILLFLLLNIEIADYFTAPGSKFIAFQFTGNFARDMTYTIAWALFALAMLIIGIVSKSRGARYAAIGLLVVTLAKLFLHDLAKIESIFRIAALLCTGVIAFIASFLYQRFVPGGRDGGG